MDDRLVFFEVEALRADRARPVLSPASLEVHVRVVDHLAHTTRANFIADEGLDTGLPTAGLPPWRRSNWRLPGWWRRLDGGYVVVDQELIDAMSRTPTRRRFGAACRRLWKRLNSETVIPL